MNFFLWSLLGGYIFGNAFVVCCLHYLTHGLFFLRLLWEKKMKISQKLEKSSRTESHPLSEPLQTEGSPVGFVLLLTMTSCKAK